MQGELGDSLVPHRLCVYVREGVETAQGVAALLKVPRHHLRNTEESLIACHVISSCVAHDGANIRACVMKRAAWAASR